MLWLSGDLFLSCCIGSKREAEDKIVPREIDADDSDVEPKSDDERSVPLSFSVMSVL